MIERTCVASLLLCLLVVQLSFAQFVSRAKLTTTTENILDPPLPDDDFADDTDNKSTASSSNHVLSVTTQPFDFKAAESVPRASRDTAVFGDGYNLGYKTAKYTDDSGPSSSAFAGAGSSYSGQQEPIAAADSSYGGSDYGHAAYGGGSYVGGGGGGGYGGGGGGEYEKPKYETYSQPAYQPTYSGWNSGDSGYGGGGGQDQSLLYALALKYARLKRRYEEDLENGQNGGTDIPWPLILAGLPFLLQISGTNNGLGIGGLGGLGGLFGK